MDFSGPKLAKYKTVIVLITSSWKDIISQRGIITIMSSVGGSRQKRIARSSSLYRYVSSEIFYHYAVWYIDVLGFQKNIWSNLPSERNKGRKCVSHRIYKEDGYENVGVIPNETSAEARYQQCNKTTQDVEETKVNKRRKSLQRWQEM